MRHSSRVMKTLEVDQAMSCWFCSASVAVAASQVHRPPLNPSQPIV